MNETTRLKEAYENRKMSGMGVLYSYFNPGYFYEMCRRERQIISLLAKYGYDNLLDKKILDLGCGNGNVLGDFLRYGALPENCFGVDLLPERIEHAERHYPNMHFQCSDAEALSFADNYFDIITCFTVFSSILDKASKLKITQEMLRVLRPNGIIIWYDYFINNPKNPDAKGIKKREIYELFSFCKILCKRVTLAPPLARMVAPYSYLACHLLENMKVLNTHYLSIIQKMNACCPGHSGSVTRK